MFSNLPRIGCGRCVYAYGLFLGVNSQSALATITFLSTLLRIVVYGLHWPAIHPVKVRTHLRGLWDPGVAVGTVAVILVQSK